jgi:peptidoglycan/LPS O-acetylase OafA/YrhL
MTSPQQTPASVKSTDRAAGITHVRGLDTLRAVLALWVVVNHHAAGALDFPTAANHFVRFGIWLFEIFFNGQAAVILFFIVSGFCIHWPYAAGNPLSSDKFLARRLLRIGLPLAAALVLGWLVGLRTPFFAYTPSAFGVPTWSLWCELMYYFLYPFLHRLILRVGIDWIFAIGFVPSLVVLLTAHLWNQPHFFDRGGVFFWRTAIMGLPFWLGGARLAANLQAAYSSGPISRISIPTIWLYRVAAYLGQGVSCLLAYRYSIGSPLTLFLLMPLFLIWMQMEIRYWSNCPESQILVWLGTMSYSIYLIHFSIFQIQRTLNQGHSPLAIRWLLSLGFILVCSWIFYRCIELPSHRLAKAAGALIKRRSETRSLIRRVDSSRDVKSAAAA